MRVLSPLMHIVATRLAESAQTAMAHNVCNLQGIVVFSPIDATVILHCHWPLVKLMMLLIALQLFLVTVPVLS